MNNVIDKAISIPAIIAEVIVFPFSMKTIAKIELTKNPVSRYKPTIVYSFVSCGKYEKNGDSFDMNTIRDPGNTFTFDGSNVGNLYVGASDMENDGSIFMYLYSIDAKNILININDMTATANRIK